MAFLVHPGTSCCKKLLIYTHRCLPLPALVSFSLLTYSLLRQWKRSLWYHLEGGQRPRVRSFLFCRHLPSLRLMFSTAPQGHWPLRLLFRETCTGEGERKKKKRYSSQTTHVVWFHQLGWIDDSPKFLFLLTGERQALPEGGRGSGLAWEALPKAATSLPCWVTVNTLLHHCPMPWVSHVSRNNGVH